MSADSASRGLLLLCAVALLFGGACAVYFLQPSSERISYSGEAVEEVGQVFDGEPSIEKRSASSELDQDARSASDSGVLEGHVGEKKLEERDASELVEDSERSLALSGDRLEAEGLVARLGVFGIEGQESGMLKGMILKLSRNAYLNPRGVAITPKLEAEIKGLVDDWAPQFRAAEVERSREFEQRFKENLNAGIFERARPEFDDEGQVMRLLPEERYPGECVRATFFIEAQEWRIVRFDPQESEQTAGVAIRYSSLLEDMLARLQAAFAN